MYVEAELICRAYGMRQLVLAAPVSRCAGIERYVTASDQHADFLASEGRSDKDSSLAHARHSPSERVRKLHADMLLPERVFRIPHLGLGVTP